MAVEGNRKESAEAGNYDPHEGAGAILWPIALGALLFAGGLVWWVWPLLNRVREALP